MTDGFSLLTHAQQIVSEMQHVGKFYCACYTHCRHQKITLTHLRAMHDEIMPESVLAQWSAEELAQRHRTLHELGAHQ